MRHRIAGICLIMLCCNLVSGRPVPGIAYEFRPLSDATPEELADAKSEASDLSTERGWGDVLGGDSDLLDFAEDALESAEAQVETAAEAPKLALRTNASVTFYALGDWGAPGLQLTSVMRTLRHVRKAVPPMALVLAGDNFYDVGVSSTRDAQWETTFRDTFAGVPEPMLAVLGNHDHYTATSPAAQVEFSRRRLDKRWVMPDMNFTRSYPLRPGSKETVQFVCVDTTALALAHAVDEVHAKLAAGEVVAASLAALNGNSQDLARRAKEQLTWLDDTLAASTAAFLVVVGHYPVYSGGDHGGAAELLRDVLPLLRAHRVDAYLSGHDHSLQHLRAHGVDFVVTGAAARLGTVRSVPHLLFGKAVPGFAALQFSDDEMVISFVDWTDAVVHQSVRRRQRGRKGERRRHAGAKSPEKAAGATDAKIPLKASKAKRAKAKRGHLRDKSASAHSANRPRHGNPTAALPALPESLASSSMVQQTVDDVLASAMESTGTQSVASEVVSETAATPAPEPKPGARTVRGKGRP